VLCANVVKYGRWEIGEIVRCVPYKKIKFRLAFQLLLLRGSCPESASPGPAPDNVLRVLQISSKSVHFRWYYSRTRERRQNRRFSRSKAANSEMVTVQLLKSYCLPFLLYGSEAVSLSATNMHILDNCINRAMYRIFHIGDYDYDVLQLRQFLGLCSIIRLVECRRKRFIDGLIESSKYGAVLNVMATNLCS